MYIYLNIGANVAAGGGGSDAVAVTRSVSTYYSTHTLYQTTCLTLLLLLQGTVGGVFSTCPLRSSRRIFPGFFFLPSSLHCRGCLIL